MTVRPDIQQNVSLRGLNSLGIAATARYFVAVHDSGELTAALAWAEEQQLATLVLGGGSNLVFAGDPPGLVIRIAMRGRHWEDVRNDEATLVLGAGENWHDSVMYAATSGYRGIENLALIPGTAGAAPVQNIGAYGVELKDTLVSVTALDRHSGETVVLGGEDCRFGYRDSLFKQDPGHYVITEIRLRLSRSRPLSLDYGDLKGYFGDELDLATLTPLDVANAVMAVRRRKLPDPQTLPNAGSFFKNPVVSDETWQRLQQDNPGIAGYPAVGSVKLAAAWLIDQCGWKGYRDARVGVHSHQALVLVNHSGGSGADILALARRIREDVKTRFGVELEMEPGVVAPPDPV
ncbi:UDP-N-acetylmuramate dehydrogenase [Marinobacter sp.]|uniref:UDP-N-acetylmuramate dehydrogenase n=1 Tax=Marinobacter sp. TaxID=50741 RepID=UPI0019A5A76B|nr:UDP-N-acetylmuramate dehydrogenase [Marinobacter sp.]MBD3656295.1 UDP-N-acetylmuramate dehydrogenase [Marinobacter sp.]